jgi:ribosomal protein S18 acetylase RimI-like enzyme
MERLALEIIDYSDEHQPWFEQLNRAWIEKYFWMEPIDMAVLQHPKENIINNSGHILMITCNREIAGTVALKFVRQGEYEFTKMAVDEKFRGQKIGQELAEAAIAKAKQLGAHKIILYSHTSLKPAISLYRKLGFIEVPLDGPYKRTDIKMELRLK